MVLVMGLRVDGVHHSPREIPKETLKRFRWPLPVVRRQQQQVSGRTEEFGEFKQYKPLTATTCRHQTNPNSQ